MDSASPDQNEARSIGSCTTDGLRVAYTQIAVRVSDVAIKIRPNMRSASGSW